jgi:leader peptidase (prepilin peptidase)/N-methyltransferase
MPISDQVTLWISALMPLLFVGAFGACVGSLLNVVAWRLPRGEGLVFPPSACPSCKTRLTWRENIPIFGWLLLRGRCRFCKSRISAEYPVVEAFVCLMFVGVCALYYTVPDRAVWLGIGWGRIKPEWAQSGPANTWPAFVVLLCLLSCLTAMTLIDAKTYTIPLALPWLATLVALLVNPAHALWVQLSLPGGELPSFLNTRGPGHRWAMPTPDWLWLGVSIGGVLGIGVSLLLLRARLITRSFADYEEWEKRHAAGHGAEAAGGEAGAAGGGAAAGGAAAGGAAAGEAAASGAGQAAENGDVGMWIAYPHARREMVREMAFLAPPAVLGWVGGYVADRWATAHATPNPDAFLPPIAPAMPLWLAALGGVLMGYLLGGALVWAVRIGGSLAFGKEAMGMGDVHLMAAVGACCGWIDSTIAFFGAAFVGVGWFVGGLAAGGRLKRAMPYGPYLAVATLLVLLSKPLIERGLNHLLQVPPGGVPINIP